MPVPNGYGHTNGWGSESGTAVPTPPPGITRVCAWKLRPAVEPIEKKIPDNTEVLCNGLPNLETVLGTDEREQARDEDFMPGGKYRAIVKLFLSFEGQTTKEELIATGWLVDNDIIATAGHCSYDHSHEYKRAVRIKAVMGYKGKESVDSKNPNFAKLDVQLRSGKAIVTTHDWLYSGQNEAADVSFILVDRPFKDVTPFTPHVTPKSGQCATLGVVGYPGDKWNPDSGEHGAFMYEDLKEQDYSFDEGVNKAKHLLQYKIDTFGGNSGSPVLARFPGSDELIPVGVHVYGEHVKNSASMIGPGGNDFPTYMNALRAFDTNSNKYPMHSGDSSQPWLTFVDLPSTGSIPDVPDIPDDPVPPKPDGPTPRPDNPGKIEDYNPTHLGGQVPGVDESFLDILNKALDIFSPESASAASTELLDDKQRSLALNRKIAPMIVPPVAALSAVALHAAGKIAATSANRTESSEGTAQPSYPCEGAAERALWGEAAIQALHHLGNEKCVKLGVFETMTEIVNELKPTVLGAAPAILHATLKEPTLRIALDNLAKATSGSPEAYDAGKRVRESGNLEQETNYKGVGFIPAAEMAEFVEGCRNACKPRHTQEFLGLATGSIGKVIGKGLTMIGPLLGSVAKTGLGLLLQGLGVGESMESGESAEHTGCWAYYRRPETFDGYAERAMVGEAALRAMVKLGPEKAQQEGLFLDMVDSVSKWAPTVIKTAPMVIRTVGTVVKEILDKKRAARSASGVELAWGGVQMSAGLNHPIVRWPMMENHEVQVLRGQPRFVAAIRDLNDPPATFGEDNGQPIPALLAARRILLSGNAEEASSLGRDTVLPAYNVYRQRMEDRLHDPDLDPIPNPHEWEDAIRRCEVFGPHPALNGDAPNLMTMFGFDVQGAEPNPVERFQIICNQPCGLWRLVRRLLNQTFGRVAYIRGEGANPGRVQFQIDMAEIGVDMNNGQLPDTHLLVSMTVEVYCRILRMMMKQFTLNTTGRPLDYWLR